MPNWCENYMSFTGPENEIREFVEKIESTQAIFQTFYPCPQELKDTVAGYYSEKPNDNWKNLLESGEITQEWYDELVRKNEEGYKRDIENTEKYGFRNWYDWRIKNWGTKWDVNDLRQSQDIFVNEDGIANVSYYFETAWGPGIEAFDKIAADYPNILFTLYYEEPGMGFCGSDVWANGEHVETESAQMISKHLDEEYLYNTYYTK